MNPILVQLPICVRTMDSYIFLDAKMHLNLHWTFATIGHELDVTLTFEIERTMSFSSKTDSGVSSTNLIS